MSCDSFQPSSKVKFLTDAKYYVPKFYRFVLAFYTPETFEKKIHDDFLKKIESSEFIFSTKIVDDEKVVQVKYFYSTKSVRDEKTFLLTLGKEWKCQTCSSPDATVIDMTRDLEIFVSESL